MTPTKNTKEDKLKTYSYEQKVGVAIYTYNMRDESIYFAKLVDILKGEISRAKIKKTLDTLVRLCMINSEWKQVNNIWARNLYISGDEYKKYFEFLANNLNDDTIEENAADTSNPISNHQSQSKNKNLIPPKKMMPIPQ